VLHEHWFGNDEEVKDTVHMWLCVKPKIFFIDGIRKIVKQSDTRVEKLGD
jgi:hypothetical protein